MDAATLKDEAARAALAHVSDGMKLGLGTGSTADAFVRRLGAAVASGLDVIGVPTSQATARLARELGIRLTTLDETPRLDLTVDGADEIGPDLALIKGGGGALLREKIVAYASDAMIVIADSSKLVDALGAFALPIEVEPFGCEATRMAVEETARQMGLAGPIGWRETNGQRLRTDGGHLILDASFGRIGDPDALAQRLLPIPGVIETGLFLGLASRAIVADGNGVREVTRDAVSASS